MRGRLLFFFSFVLSSLLGVPAIATRRTHQNSIEQLKLQLEFQYAKIQKVIAAPPRRSEHPLDYDRRLREWQDDLAPSFVAAPKKGAQIIKLKPPHLKIWPRRPW